MSQYLGAADADRILRSLFDPDGGLIVTDRTVVVATHHLPDDIRCPQLNIAVGRYADCRSFTPA